MSKGKRRREREEKMAKAVLQDLEQHRGLSKYERKKMAQKGIETKIGGTP